jgi:ATP phosphoribosyltransferase
MSPTLKLVIPKGRLQEKVQALLARIGIDFTINQRSYKPKCSDPAIDVKMLKPSNIPSLVAMGRHDCGFTGDDWLEEERIQQNNPHCVHELLDLGYDRVRLIAAVPDSLAQSGAWKRDSIIVASEYPNLTQRFIREKGLNAVFVRTSGATEALPPEDADMIIDNTSTGATLEMNRLTIVDALLTSTTRFFAWPEAMKDDFKREKLTEMTLLMRSALEAQRRMLLEMNVGKTDLEKLVNCIPSMRAPTVAPLYGEEGYAVKVSVPMKDVPRLIPELLALGATDILAYRLEHIVPNGFSLETP